MKKQTFLIVLTLLTFLMSCQKDNENSLSGDYVKLTVSDGREFISYVDNKVGFKVGKCVTDFRYDPKDEFEPYDLSFNGYFENFDSYFLFFIKSETKFETGIEYKSLQKENFDEKYPSYLDIGISGIDDYYGKFIFKFDEISVNGRVKGKAVAYSRGGNPVLTFEFDFQDI